MKKLVILATLVLTGCESLPEGKDNTTDQWERIAEVSVIPGVYKVTDIEDGVICYYVVGGFGAFNRGPTGISCLAASLPSSEE